MILSRHTLEYSIMAIDHFLKSAAYPENFEAARAELWQMLWSSYGNKCPHCGKYLNALDKTVYKDGETKEIECEHCEKPITLHATVSLSYRLVPTIAENILLDEACK